MSIEIVSTDKSGRMVLPKSVRDEYGIREGTQLFVVGTGKGILLQKLDAQEVAARLAEEIKGIDVKAIVEETREEVRARIKKRYSKVFD